MNSIEYTGLTFITPNSVYSPAEDSFLLAKYSKTLKGKILDMGTGSGIQAIVNAKTNPNNQITAADVNPSTTTCAKQNAQVNDITNIRFIQSNLFENITESFDGIIFNPPYLPEEDSSKDEELALSGGQTGRELTDKFIDQFPQHLNPNGTVLLLQSSINNVEKTKQKLLEKKFKAEIIDQESFFFEKLYVLKITRT